jgi:8-oxo-dGTP diphosphatase
MLALPGGFVRPDESLDVAATRELLEETGLALDSSRSRARHDHAHLEQLRSYGDPGRDPRMHVVTVAYLALAPELPAPQPGGDASAAGWLPVRDAAPGLAFDHDTILADGVERARSKLEYTPLATAFCPPQFTVGQLRRVYETVWDTRLDPRNFHRKVTGTPGFLVPTGLVTEGDRGRPAQLYRRGHATTLYPPMLRDRLD